MGYKALQYFKLMRVHQYIKNLFIFAPLFFAFNFSLDSLLKVFFVFIAFSFVASAVYVFNDVRDVEQDRLHPKKKNRPIASGEIKYRDAIIFAVFLLCIGGGEHF